MSGSVPPLRQLTLIGVGLIGGSFALDLKRHKLAEHVVGIDLNRDNLDRALERRVIDQAETEMHAAAFAEADLVLLATPVSTLPQLCRRLADVLPERTIVSDIGSTKQSALAAFRQYLPQHFADCVAAHPIAGSDRSGALAAQFGLYQNKKLIVCPHEAQNPEALARVETLWQAVGAQTCRMSAAEHDVVFAAVSHLPHLLAFAYMHQMLDDPNGHNYLQFAGSGFRDFTRIAAGHPQMWADIAQENRELLLQLLADQQQQLARLQQCLQQNDNDALYRYLAEASHARRQWQG